jgi:hypothetical protein
VAESGPTEEYISAIRALDESDLARSYWHFFWEEEGSHWYEETVNEDGREWAVKQLVVEADGTVLRYWWRHIEDDAGFLADQPLDPMTAGLERISAQGFFDLWGRRSEVSLRVSSRALAQPSFHSPDAAV